MPDKIKGLLSSIFLIAGFFLMFGAVGAYETDRVTFTVALIEGLIGVLLMVVGDMGLGGGAI